MIFTEFLLMQWNKLINNPCLKLKYTTSTISAGGARLKCLSSLDTFVELNLVKYKNLRYNIFF